MKVQLNAPLRRSAYCFCANFAFLRLTSRYILSGDRSLTMQSLSPKCLHLEKDPQKTCYLYVFCYIFQFPRGFRRICLQPPQTACASYRYWKRQAVTFPAPCPDCRLCQWWDSAWNYSWKMYDMFLLYVLHYWSMIKDRDHRIFFIPFFKTIKKRLYFLGNSRQLFF